LERSLEDDSADSHTVNGPLGLWAFKAGSEFNTTPRVFKTVCGALQRRPGWVRFPSIPANFRRNDSQDDSQDRKRFSEPSLGCAMTNHFRRQEMTGRRLDVFRFRVET
jgi:hypothetical protein